MSMKRATMIALVGAVISILDEGILSFFGLLRYGILGLVIHTIPPITYLIFFIVLFTRQK